MQFCAFCAFSCLWGDLRPCVRPLWGCVARPAPRGGVSCAGAVSVCPAVPCAALRGLCGSLRGFPAVPRPATHAAPCVPLWDAVRPCAPCVRLCARPGLLLSLSRCPCRCPRAAFPAVLPCLSRRPSLSPIQPPHSPRTASPGVLRCHIPVLRRPAVCASQSVHTPRPGILPALSLAPALPVLVGCPAPPVACLSGGEDNI